VSDAKDEESTSENQVSEDLTSHAESPVEVTGAPEQVATSETGKGTEGKSSRKTPIAESPVEVTGAPEEVSSPEIVEGAESKSRRKEIAWFVIVIVLVGGFFAVQHFRGGADVNKIQGKVALSAQELRDVVVAKKLTVYWAGPQDGAKYILTATTPGVASVRYLPGGVGLNDTKTLFRAIGTYTVKNAFDVAAAATKRKGIVGFVNADGNAVFYSTGRPTNVYIGIKGKNLQVEVFDPVVNQALGWVLVKNQVRQIN
jgi:hypothetical protein